MSKLDDSLKKLNVQLEALKGIKTDKALLAGALTLQKFSQQSDRMPVDTGFLRSSASSEIVDEHAEMSFSAEYAIYQELGTEHIPARLFVTKAIDEHEGDVIRDVSRQIQKDIKGAL